MVIVDNKKCAIFIESINTYLLSISYMQSTLKIQEKNWGG